MRTNRKPILNFSFRDSLIRFIQFNPAFATAFLTIAILALLWSPQRPQSLFRLDCVVEVTGWVSRVPEARGEAVYFELSPKTINQEGHLFPYSGRVAVWVSSSHNRPQDIFEPPLQYGEILRFRTFLKEPAFYAIPGVQDSRWLAWLQGTPLRAQLKSPHQLERLGKNWIGVFLSPFFDYLNHFEEHSQQVLSDRTFRFLLGVFLGRKRSLEETETELIRNLGLLHLFVVSGFHISLIVLLLHSTLRILGRIGSLATVAGIWLYILGIGFPLAAIRAGIIATLAYFLLSLGLRRSLLNGLGISALAIAGLSPKSIFTASFHLSYICLCAIGLLVLPCAKYVQAIRRGITDLRSGPDFLGRTPELILRRKIRFSLESQLCFLPGKPVHILKKPLAHGVNYILTLLLCSFCIQLLLFPVALHYTNRWSLTQGLSNLLLMPMFALLITLCFLLFLTFWTPLAPVISWTLEHWSTLCHDLILALASFSPVAFLPHPKGREIMAYLGLTSFLILALPRKTKTFALLIPICLLLALGPIESDGDGLFITMLDVGQGESIHLRYPSGESALIDTGGLSYPPRGNFVGERLVSRYLWHLRVRELLYVLITHPDHDHKQGYSFIKKAFPIGLLMYSQTQSDYEEPKKCLSAGDSFSIAGVRHVVHHPSAKALQEAEGNEASLVLTLEYGSFSMLFTGDITGQIESELLPQLTPITALKVAHHGSNSSSSSDFLRATRPTIAIISAGRGNNFGHPSISVLKRLKRYEAKVFSTKEAGSLRLITDGFSWKVQHYSIATGCFEDLLEPQPLQVKCSSQVH